MTATTTVSSPLLDYAIISDPYPLYAADAQSLPATLNITVSNGGASTVYCREILFYLPIGTYAQSLLRAKGGEGKENSGNWTVTRLQDDVNGGLPKGEYAKFKAVPKSGEMVAVDKTGVTFSLTGLYISTVPGTARIEIRETTTQDLTKWPVNPVFTPHKVPKFPRPAVPANVVCDFHAKPADVVEGAPDVARGAKVTLHWRGPSNLSYTVLAGSGATEVPTEVATETGEPHSAGNTNHYKTYCVQRDTAFVLSYTIAGATYHLSTTVTVKDPKLDGLTCAGNLTAESAVTLKGKVTAQKDLDCRGAITGSSLDAGTGSITTSGTIKGSALKIGTSYGIDKDGAITGSSLDAGSGNITTSGMVKGSSLDAGAGDITTSGTIKGSSLKIGTSYGIDKDGAITGSSLDAGSGNITTSGKVSDNGEILRFGDAVIIRNQHLDKTGLNEDNKANGGVSLRNINSGNARWWWYLDRSYDPKR
ncbi:hypothetical protein [Streptomyces sp. URMC 129]|uniref:hypothetical protein n=1 Tax=Streptomyces sp. URMC 129 TaxID=3423407 RepID=UPI003F1C4A5D